MFAFNADAIRTLGYISVRDPAFGARGDGVTDDRAAIQAALDTAAVLGSDVYFPPGIYIVGKSVFGAWCLTLDRKSNVTLRGIRGVSIIRQAAGLPASSVACLRLNECTNINLSGLTIDGNWGNVITSTAASMNGLALPQATINVEATTVDGHTFPSAGTFVMQTTNGLETITYTGITATSFTGCSGGTGTCVTGYPIGRVDSQTGLNQGTQGDPKNYGVMVRGCRNVNIDNCEFVQNYGDAIWLGQGGTDFSTFAQNVNITRTRINVTARSGVAAAQKCARIRMNECQVGNIYAQSWDTEPVGSTFGVHDVVISDSVFTRWFGVENPLRDNNIIISITSGQSLATTQSDAARNFRVENCEIEGTIYISNSIDVAIVSNRVVCDWSGNSYAPIAVISSCDDVRILDNYIYSRTVGFNCCIAVGYNGVGENNYQPQGIVVRGNRIHARNGNVGILVSGTGGIEFGGGVVPGFDGVASGIAGLVVTDAGQAWTDNQWVGYHVAMGGAYGTIAANTADTFTVTAWQTPLGNPYLTPAAGAYTVYSGGQVVDVDHNMIDCTDDGYGQGSYAISLAATRAGMRVRVRGNTAQNPATSSILIDNRFRQSELFEITDNHVFNNMVTPNTDNNLEFMDGVDNITKLIIRGNTQEGAIEPMAGVSSGVWLVEDGVVQRWAGWDSPNGVISARVGSLFHRRDDGAAAALWIKQNFEDQNVGWVAVTENPEQAWDIDPGSGIGVPSDATQWQAVIDAAGLNGVVTPPDALWLCQEAAGPLADSIGAFDLAESGLGLAYQQNVSAWERSAVQTADNVVGGWYNTDAGLPDVNVAPMTMLVYAIETSQPANPNRQIFGLGGTGGANTMAWIGGGQQTRVVSGANTASSADIEWNVVRPYVLKHDPTGAATIGYTDLSKVQPTFSAAVTGKKISLGSGQVAPSFNRILYGCAFFVALTDSQIRDLLRVLGWQPQW